MRTSLLPLLIRGIQRHERILDTTGRLEVARVYHKNKNGEVWNKDTDSSYERYAAAFVLGSRGPHASPWEEHPFYHGKYLLAMLMERLGVDRWQWILPREADLALYPWAHPKESIALAVRGKTIGLLGVLHPEVQSTLGLTELTTVGAEWYLEPLLPTLGTPRYVPGDEYPSTTRDLSLVVPVELHSEAFTQTLSKASSLLRRVSLDDVYTGPHVETGTKSLTYTLSFGHAERTLTGEEVEQEMAQIIRKAQEKGAVIRGL